MIDVEPTAKVCDDIGKIMVSHACDIQRYADAMRNTGDISEVTAVMASIKSCFNSLRTDLLITRPIREYERELATSVCTEEN